MRENDETTWAAMKKFACTKEWGVETSPARGRERIWSARAYPLPEPPPGSIIESHVTMTDRPPQYRLHRFHEA